MQNEDMVPATEFCMHHNIELSFIHSLKEYDMIETVLKEEKIYLPISELPRLEKIIRLHFELDINLEGIETITHLLKRMELMQERIIQLTNRIKGLEG
jgi:chaperone modulatory protein CbpM